MSKLIVSSLLVAVLGSSSFATGSPRVAGSVPANGAADVDPAMRHIVVTFDTAMKTDGFSVLQSSEGAFPELSGDEPLVFRDAKTFVMSIKLSPGRGYAIRLNSESRQGFRAVDGAPLPPTVIRFRTHGGEAVKPESRKG
ncbi:MAG: Ig-like domain-containing protein, partial [Phycisphaerae bacterium]|nr:Ig-like domain-containing protein [Phycisphaerae bacterium]